MSPRYIDIRVGGADAQRDTAATLRSAICIYLIAERRDGATIGELARLALGGRSATDEVARVSKAVSQLVQDGEVTMEGDRVCPVVVD